MNCSNTKCKKEIRNYYTCNKCGKLFCTNSCMTEHTLELHSTPKQPTRNSGVKSMFMKYGQFNKEIFDDPYYNISNFEIVRNKKALGSGAFGDVYLIKHKMDGKQYALKLMNKARIIQGGASLEIIYREISIHRRIKHESIVQLYSHSEDRDNFNLIMDYIESGTLFNVIKKNKYLDEKKSFKYFIQVCSAINFLHMNNLVHRDLKPENILIDENDNVKLCDFGWCVDITAGNRVTFCGTYEYMAPEIIKEIPYDFSIDVWSLGILLYELTHGYSPFRAVNNDVEEDYDEIFRNILKYKLRIEKPLTRNCQDLIIKLLSPCDKKRITVKEIFSHPWVMEFEKEAKELKIKNSLNENNNIRYEANNKIVSNIINEVKPKQIIISDTKIKENKSDDYQIQPKKNEIEVPKLDLNKLICFYDDTAKEALRKNSLKKEKNVKLINPNNNPIKLEINQTELEDNEFPTNKNHSNNNDSLKNDENESEKYRNQENLTEEIDNNKNNDQIIINDSFNESLEYKNEKNIVTNEYSSTKSSGNNSKIDINANNSIYIKKDDLKEDDSYENTKLIGINDSISDLKKNLSKTEENNSKEFFIDNELLFKTKKDKEETSLKQIEEKQIINTQDLKINMNNDSNKKIYLDSDICKSNNDKTKNTKNIKIDKEHDKDINPSIKFVEEIAPNNPEINKTNDKNKQIIKINREVDIDVNEIRKIDNKQKSVNNSIISDNSQIQNSNQIKRDKDLESEIKEVKIIDKCQKSDNNSTISNNSFIGKDKKSSNSKNSNNQEFSSPIKKNTNNIDISDNIDVDLNSNIKEKKKKIKSKPTQDISVKQDNTKILIDNNSIKLSQNAIEESLFENDVFDQVMSQVKNRNKDKKKKTKKDNTITNNIESEVKKENMISADNNIKEKNKQYEGINNENKLNNKNLEKKIKYNKLERELDIKENENYKNNNKSFNFLKNEDFSLPPYKKQDFSFIEIKRNEKIKDFNKELDLCFLPKDLLYNDKTYFDSNKRMLAAIDILEKAQYEQNKIKLINEEKEPESGFWGKVGSYLNPFKCGKNG